MTKEELHDWLIGYIGGACYIGGTITDEVVDKVLNATLHWAHEETKVADKPNVTIVVTEHGSMDEPMIYAYNAALRDVDASWAKILGGDDAKTD